MHHGVLTVYKEAGYTSGDAVARLRGILRMRRIGHTGTLDPDAEGVLPMCLGNATRICELIADREKEYLAVMRLGVQTDTQDMSGEILRQIPDDRIPAVIVDSDKKRSEKQREAQAEEKSVKRIEKALKSPSEEERERIAGIIRKAAAAFTGEIEQIPPMYSAIRLNGKRLYEMARRGITVERKPRRIRICALEIEKIELPLVTMRIRCSKGTYIRTLCEDIGNALGTGAAMQSLLRTRVGRFTLDEARTLDELESIVRAEPERLLPLIRTVDSFFAGLPAAACAPEALRLLKNGNALTTRQFRFLPEEEDPQSSEGKIAQIPDSASLPGIGSDEQVIRMYDADGSFYGLYRNRSGANCRGVYSPYKMFLPEQEQ